jgi:DNA polymerase-3 subunit delta'
VIYPWQQQQWQTLQNAVREGRLPHALLLTGKQGIGKLDFATSFADFMLCQEPQNQTPCGKCHSCQLFNARTHPDFKLIAAEEGSVIKVDQVREMVEQNSLTPHVSSSKLYLFVDADSMNVAASNSLLKTLEEPSPNSLIILITSRPDLLSATIRSRCQQIKFNQPSQEQAIEWLTTQTTHADAKTLLNLAQGSPLTALKIDHEDQKELNDSVFADFGRVIFGKSDPVKVANDWQKHDLKLIFNWLTIWVIDVIRLKYNDSEPMINSADKLKALLKIASAFTLEQLFELYEKQLQTGRLLDKQVSKPLLVESFLVSCVLNR